MRRQGLFALVICATACTPAPTPTSGPTATPAPTATRVPTLAETCVRLDDEVVATFAKGNSSARAVFAAAALRDDPSMAGAFQRGGPASRDKNIVEVYSFDDAQEKWYRAEPVRRWSKPGYDKLYERAGKCGEWARDEWGGEQ